MLSSFMTTCLSPSSLLSGPLCQRLHSLHGDVSCGCSDARIRKLAELLCARLDQRAPQRHAVVGDLSRVGQELVPVRVVLDERGELAGGVDADLTGERGHVGDLLRVDRNGAEPLKLDAPRGSGDATAAVGIAGREVVRGVHRHDVHRAGRLEVDAEIRRLARLLVPVDPALPEVVGVVGRLVPHVAALPDLVNLCSIGRGNVIEEVVSQLEAVLEVLVPAVAVETDETGDETVLVL